MTDKKENLNIKDKVLEKSLIDCSTFALSKMAEIYEYKDYWSEEFCKKEIIECFEKITEELKKHKEKIIELPVEILQRWRFGTMGESRLLCPIYLKQLYFPGKEYDSDHRGFLLAYGWTIKEGKVIVNEEKKGK